jgi:4-amino-4-deoxy-L-arabinose transferase-like glycosyltransferase
VSVTTGEQREPLAGEAPRTRRAAIGAAARPHLIFLLLLAGGVVLRCVTSLAYRPAIFGIADSNWYLAVSQHLEPSGLRPVGYSAFLRLLPLDGRLALVPAVQHLVGLGCGVLVYALLLRLGVRRWLAALAAAPVLLDAYQLNIEQQILSETVFQALLLGGGALLLWSRPLPPWNAAAAGLAFGAAALMRPVGLVVIVPAAVTILFLRSRPSRVVTLASLAAAFALPLALYAAWFESVHGRYGLSTYGGHQLYGRVAEFVECGAFAVPEHERPLCPVEPVGERPAPNFYIWSPESPARSVEPPSGMTRDDVVGDFSRRAIRNQPLAYARAVGSDFLHGLSPAKTSGAGGFEVDPWHFQRTFPVFYDGRLCPEAAVAPAAATREGCAARARATSETIREYGGDEGEVDRTLASFLRFYQRFGYTTGPLLAAGLVVALLAVVGVGRARRAELRAASFLFATLGAGVFLAAVSASSFSWRYQLPLVVLLPPAAAAGIETLLGGRGAHGARTEPVSEP